MGENTSLNKHNYTKESIWKKNLVALWMSQLFVNMGYGLAMPFVPYHMETLAVMTEAQLSFYTGLASSIPAAFTAIGSPMWGVVGDRYGRKRMITLAIVLGTVIIVLLGLANNIPLFLVFRALNGFFTGSFAASMALISANTPDRNLSQSIGFMTSSSFLGYAMGPVIGGFLCNWFTYRTCFFIGGAINALGLIALVFVHELPGTYGFELIEQRKLKKAQGNNSGSIMSAGVMLILVTMLFMRFSRTVFSPFVPLYVRELLGGMDGATTYIGIINGAVCVATAVASVTLARLGDKFDKFGFTAILTAIALGLTCVICFDMPLWLFIIGYGAYYFFVGGVEPILTSAASEIVDASSLGVLFGLLNTVSSIGMMLSPMIGSAVSMAAGTRAIIVTMPVFTAMELVATIVMMMYIKKKREKEDREYFESHRQ